MLEWYPLTSTLSLTNLTSLYYIKQSLLFVFNTQYYSYSTAYAAQVISYLRKVSLTYLVSVWVRIPFDKIL